MLKGEIAQLKTTEQSIIDLIENLSKAKERDIARQETAKKLREAREIEKERRAQFKSALPKEQADSIEETKDDLVEKSGVHFKEDTNKPS
jgi:Asp-tRNA(Asn)/Glu-tRNA(Gln) amidotransferase C subunit